MKTILVPTDFSNAAENATEYAIKLAADMRASILLLHVYNVPVIPITDVPVIYPLPMELHEEAERILEKRVVNLKKRVTDIEIKFKAVMGSPVREIEQLSKSFDFIVMGMRNVGKLSELLIGSVAMSVIKAVTTPVFIIPEKVTYMKPSKIVLATDYSSKTDFDTLEPLKQMIGLYNSKLFIVNIKTEQETVENVIAEDRIEKKFAEIDHLYYFPERDDLVKGINEFITVKKADLLAIVPHRYNWIEGLFHRSASKKIASHTSIPLLALPDKFHTN